MRLVSAIALLAISSLALAQATEAPAKPSTRLEAFQANTGFVIVRGYTTVGVLRGMTGSVTVDASEFRDARNPARRAAGISIKVREEKQPDKEKISFIDGDEVDDLLQGIDYLSKASKALTTLDNFEAEYTTRGDFRLTVFSNKNSGGQLSLAVSKGGVGKTAVYLKFAQLAELRQLIVAAKAKL